MVTLEPTANVELFAGLVMLTAGEMLFALVTVTPIADEVVDAPKLSIARAVKECVPDARVDGNE